MSKYHYCGWSKIVRRAAPCSVCGDRLPLGILALFDPQNEKGRVRNAGMNTPGNVQRLSARLRLIGGWRERGASPRAGERERG